MSYNLLTMEEYQPGGASVTALIASLHVKGVDKLYASNCLVVYICTPLHTWRDTVN